MLTRQSVSVGRLASVAPAVTTSRPTRSIQVRAQAQQSSEASQPADVLSATRRAALLAVVAGAVVTPSANATALQDFARGFIREDVGPVDAVVTFIDSIGALKEIQRIAAEPADSEVRFRSRALWPGLAGRLRGVGPAAPVVVGLVTGSADKEATLSEEYGGRAGAEPGVADRVYVTMGKVLTISGRTIRVEAQNSPERAADAQAAIEEFLAKVPRDVYNAAVEARKARAAAKAAAANK